MEAEVSQHKKNQLKGVLSASLWKRPQLSTQGDTQAHQVVPCVSQGSCWLTL